MPDIDLKKEDIPFWAGGNGVLRVHLNVADPTKALPASDDDLMSASFNVGGTQPFSVGGKDNFKLGVKADASATLTPYWATSGDRLKALEPYGLLGYFDAGANHADRLLLALALGADASADLSGKFKYTELTAEASLDAGADASYVLVRSFPVGKPAGEVVTEFFKDFRLPADVSQPLTDDEVIILEYGGYLNFAASVGVGYELSGSQGIDISQLKFAERYSFSLMAKLGLTGGVAGRFRIEVRPGANGWAHVVVRKSRDKRFSIAADVTAGATFESEGLPGSADDFVSALVGLNSKNWLQLFNQVESLTDFNSLRLYLDKLAQGFVEQYMGKAFDALADKTQLDEALALIQRAAKQYRDVGDRAVTLFDKYFDVVKGAVDDKLGEALNFIKGAASWDAIKGKINDKIGDPRLAEVLWGVVGQLTDGDPLNWMLGKVNVGGQVLDSLQEIKDRADKAMSLVEDQANAEIRRLVALAKSKFPFDSIAGELADLDWVKLKGMIDKRLVGFVERLIGQSVEKLSNSELGDAVKRFHEVLAAVDGFKEKLFGKGGLAEQALNSSYKFNLHAEYKKATEDGALLDIELDLGEKLGRELMNKAGKGDFLGVVEGYEAGVVKLNEGVFSHKVTRESTLAVSVEGWHLNAHYQSLERVITEYEQRVVPESDGRLTVLTSFDLQKEKDKERRVGRQRERFYTNAMLRFFGESRGVLDSNPQGNTFLVDSITGMAFDYQFVIQDNKTDRHELAQYLSFADEFGIAGAEAAVEPYLHEEQGSLGETSITYKAGFTEDGLRSLFGKPFGPDEEKFLRQTMRLIVLANYLGKPGPFPTWGWCYWSSGLYNKYHDEGPNFLQHSAWTVDVDPSTLKNLQPPSKQVVLSQSNGGIQVLYTLYRIEDSMVNGMKRLSETIQAQKKLDPRDFEKKLGGFGDALKLYDDFDEGPNTVFALFDRLVQRAAAGKPYRASSLEVKIKQDGKETTKLLVA